jgi:hypothetical protein
MRKAIGRSTVVRHVSATCILLGCGDLGGAELVAGSAEELFLTGSKFPGREVPICFTATTMARSDFALQRDRVLHAVNRSWIAATGLRFTGFGACSGDAVGSIRVHVGAGGEPSCGSAPSCSENGYQASSATDVHLVAADGVGGALGVPPAPPEIMRHIGNALGFRDERARTDFTDPCKGNVGGASGDTLHTLPDRESVTTWIPAAAAGAGGGASRCNSNQRLSYWDRVGAQNAYGHSNYFADVTGDGRADLIAIRADCITVLPAGTNQFNLPPAPSSPCWTTGPWWGHKGTFFADVTGDGKADAIAIDNTRVLVRASTGTSFAAQRTWISSAWYGEVETHVADVTGDGKADLIGIDASGISVRASSGTSFPGPTLNFGPRPEGPHGIFFARVSGFRGAADRLADLVVLSAAGARVALSNGQAFVSSASWFDGVVDGAHGTFLADASGDGRADLITIDADGVRVRRASTTSFGAPELWRSAGTFGQRGTFFADVNGDSRADLVNVEASSTTAAHSSGSAFPSLTTYTSFGWDGGRLDGG